MKNLEKYIIFNLKKAGIKGVVIIDTPNELELEEAVKTFKPFHTYGA